MAEEAATNIMDFKCIFYNAKERKGNNILHSMVHTISQHAMPNNSFERSKLWKQWEHN